jgi:hypothetical protein
MYGMGHWEWPYRRFWRESWLIAVQPINFMSRSTKGGAHDASNFMLAHKQCNKEKHNKTLWEHWDWRYSRGQTTNPMSRDKRGPPAPQAR